MERRPHLMEISNCDKFHREVSFNDTNEFYCTRKIVLALLYNLRVYIQIFPLVGGTSRRRVSPYKREYLYIHDEYLNIF